MYSGDDDSPFHDSEVEALEDAMRRHPAKGFRISRYVTSCPNCGRGLTSHLHLQPPHWNPDGLPVCITCRSAGAKWHRDPKQREYMKELKARRETRGIEPKVGFL